MIKIHNSTVTNLTDKKVQVVSLGMSNETGLPQVSKWLIVKNADHFSINLQDFPQADQDESLANYRIVFDIEGEEQYGFFTIWTEWNRMYYSTTPDSFVASPDCKVLGTNNLPSIALEGPDVSNMVANFQVTILDKRQIMVRADVTLAVGEAA